MGVPAKLIIVYAKILHISIQELYFRDVESHLLHHLRSK